ncbi:MAG: SEC-C metal-binding domain-containing protein, partial [Verrucomicrobiota bacterium]
MPSDLFAQALVERTRDTPLYRAGIQELVEQLPETPDELEQLFEELISDRDAGPFSKLWVAAHLAQRPLSAHLLREGAALLEDLDVLLMTHDLCQGNVCHALLEAVGLERMGEERELTCIVLAAKWWQTHRPSSPFPADLLIHGRRKARHHLFLPPMAEITLLWALQELTEDEVLTSFLEQQNWPKQSPDRFWDIFKRLDLASWIPEKRPERVISGYTVRRAVPKLSRNAPCHCGSGKKYKKCCADQDQERLMDSSEISGLTQREMEEDIESFLTREKLQQMRSYEVYRLNPKKVDPELLPWVLDRLCLFGEFDRVCDIADTLPEISSMVENRLIDALCFAGDRGRLDVVRRLLALHPPLEEHLPIEIKLALTPDATSFLPLVEEAAQDILENETPAADADLAIGILRSPYPALGVLLARSSLTSTRLVNSEVLLEGIEEARQRLSLSPIDLAEDIVDWRIHWEENQEAVARDTVAKEELHAKHQEMNRLRLEVETLQRELTKQEEAASLPQKEQEKDNAPLPEEDSAASEEMEQLRSRLETTRDELK